MIDSGTVRAVGGGEKTNQNPTDRGKPEIKHHVLADANGIPLNAILTGESRHAVPQLLPLIHSAPSVCDKAGYPKKHPRSINADRDLWLRTPSPRTAAPWGSSPDLAERNTPHGSGLGVYRWAVERTISWLHQFRRLRVRFERRKEIHKALMALAESLICFRGLRQAFRKGL
jgi:transposase